MGDERDHTGAGRRRLLDVECQLRNPWLRGRWRIPLEEKAEFVARLDDVLAVYARPVDPARPVVCVDERSAAACFLAVAPNLGWRHVAVIERGDAVGWARFVRELVDTHFSEAERIVLVLDDRSIHDPASFYNAFPPAEARRILDNLDLHVTPRHGHWLNLAELELAALARRCLARRIRDRATLAAEAAAWADARNAARVTLGWRFTIADARAVLAHLYPVISPEH